MTAGLYTPPSPVPTFKAQAHSIGTGIIVLVKEQPAFENWSRSMCCVHCLYQYGDHCCPMNGSERQWATGALSPAATPTPTEPPRDKPAAASLPRSTCPRPHSRTAKTPPSPKRRLWRGRGRPGVPAEAHHDEHQGRVQT